MKVRAMVVLAIISLACLCSSCMRKSPSSYWPTAEWRVTSPQQVGMDAKVLEGLTSIQESIPKISSILAVRHGYIVFEKYYLGDAKTLRSAFDITRSVVSCLIGVAQKQGLIKSIDQRMIDFFPENQIIRSDPLTQEVSLRHLLTMSDGIRDSGNTIEYYFLDSKLFRKLRGDPGLKFQYNDMSAQIVSMILTKVSGQTAHEFAKKHLFSYIGITDSSWKNLKTQGFSNGSYGILLTSRDLAKIGYLYLRNGYWEGKELVAAKWIIESTSAQIETEDTSEYFKQYGYYWWIHTFGSRPGYFAIGWNGQVICIVPEVDFVAVVTSEEVELKPSEQKYLEMIEKYLIGSIIK